MDQPQKQYNQTKQKHKKKPAKKLYTREKVTTWTRRGQKCHFFLSTKVGLFFPRIIANARLSFVKFVCVCVLVLVLMLVLVFVLVIIVLACTSLSLCVFLLAVVLFLVLLFCLVILFLWLIHVLVMSVECVAVIWLCICLVTSQPQRILWLTYQRGTCSVFLMHAKQYLTRLVVWPLFALQQIVFLLDWFVRLWISFLALLASISTPSLDYLAGHWFIHSHVTLSLSLTLTLIFAFLFCFDLVHNAINNVNSVTFLSCCHAVLNFLHLLLT